MKRALCLARRRAALALVTALALLSLAASHATVVRSFAVSAGGGRSSGGAFALTGATGQPVATVSSGGTFRLTGGLLGPVAGQPVYLPVVRR